MARDIESVKKELNGGRKVEREKLNPADLLSSGSTLLNLAMSGLARGAFYKGKCYHFVGDSDSGKTFITLTCFAEASINKAFDGYRLIHDNPEDGALMNLSRYFGEAANKRIRPPQGTRAEPRFSQTVEEFYYNLDDALDHEKPCVYVLDSMDALSAKQDAAKFQEQKSNARKDRKEKETGTFGMAKAKNNSTGMREVFNKLKRSKSIVIIVSQAKTNVGFGVMEKKTYSGGLSLKFYSHAQLWSSPMGQLKKTINGRPRPVGTVCQVRVKKNRQTGRKSSAKVLIYTETGIDDTGACVDYLVEERHWPKANGLINAKELDVKMNREDLIVHVEKSGLTDQVQDVVETLYDRIRDASRPDRVNKYHKGE